MDSDIKNLKKRLIYRSLYRGTREMDKLIGSFVKSSIDSFNSEQLQELEKFLSVDDDTLYKIYNEQKDELEGISTTFIKLYRSYKYEE